MDDIPIKNTGDYQEAAINKVMTDPELVTQSLKRIIGYGEKRKSVLIFCVSIEHCNIIRMALLENGIVAGIVTGETDKAEREEILSDFKDGKLEYLINCEVLTTGFDATNIDTIICLRPTKSKSLFEQIVGRGVRKAEGKDDCLLVDMGGNLAEHGAIGSPLIMKEKKKKDEPEEAKSRICPECEEFCPPASKSCPDCGLSLIHISEPTRPY